jgi:magnesium transporter
MDRQRTSGRHGRKRRHDVAAAHLVTRLPRARPDDSADQALAALRGQDLDLADIIFVTDAGDRLVGLLPMVRLLQLAGSATLRGAMQAPPPAVAANTDQEQVLALARRTGLSVVPVIGPDGTLLGAVPAAALLDIGRREHHEDISRLAGIVHHADPAHDALEGPPLQRAKRRLPWLLVGLAGSLGAAAVMASFEATLAAQVAVAFFVPAIVYLADAIGTQTEAVAVRGLAGAQGGLGHLLLGELATGGMIGFVLGALAVPPIWAVFGDLRLAAAVGISVLVAGSVATSIGLLLPWLLAHLGRDPAYGSGPVATIIQDVLSIAVYFLVVTALA